MRRHFATVGVIELGHAPAEAGVSGGAARARMLRATDLALAGEIVAGDIVSGADVLQTLLYFAEHVEPVEPGAGPRLSLRRVAVPMRFSTLTPKCGASCGSKATANRSLPPS